MPLCTSRGNMMLGDLPGNIERVRDELRKSRYDGPVDLTALASGEPAGYLPLLHFVLLRSSRPVAQWIADKGYELYSKSDLRFVFLVTVIGASVMQYLLRKSQHEQALAAVKKRE